MEKELNKYMIDDIMAIVVDYVDDPWKKKFDIVIWELKIKSHQYDIRKTYDNMTYISFFPHHHPKKSLYLMNYTQYHNSDSQRGYSLWTAGKWDSLMYLITIFDKSRLKSHNKI